MGEKRIKKEKKKEKRKKEDRQKRKKKLQWEWKQQINQWLWFPTSHKKENLILMHR